VFALTGSFALVTAAMGLLNASIPAFFEEQLGQDDAYGYAMATIAAGLLCGELLTSFVTRESVARRSVSLAFLASAVCLSLLALSEVRATAFLMLFFLGVADGTTEVVYDTLFQLELRRSIQAGVFALASAIQNGGMVVGLLLAPVLLAYASGVTVIAISAAGCLAGSLVALPLLFTGGARERNHPDRPWSWPDEAAEELG
jgi:MFS family permease